MFSFFKKRSKVEILQEKFETLLQESFELSKINRLESDKKFVEAQSVMIEIDKYKI